MVVESPSFYSTIGGVTEGLDVDKKVQQKVSDVELIIISQLKTVSPHDS